MLNTLSKVRTIRGCRADTIPYQELMEAGEPVILKDVARDWGLVKSGLQSYDTAVDYIKSFYNGLTVGVYIGHHGSKGRYFYNEDLTGLNFDVKRLPLDQVLDEMRSHFKDDDPPPLYVGSTSMDACLPEMRRENELQFNHAMFENNRPLTSIWLGNPSIASAHYDAPNNIACCVVGKRRFTLFPPDQTENLYPGPLDPTPGGQAVSMVDFRNPDYKKYPKFQEALKVAQVAEMEPGDALFYPGLWWHNVEATESFNVLINYWWSASPKFMGTPMNVLYHAILSLRDRPEPEKQAWKELFDYYIFGSSERPREHLPKHAHGDLAEMDDTKARRLRAMLINKLNR